MCTLGVCVLDTALVCMHNKQHTNMHNHLLLHPFATLWCQQTHAHRQMPTCRYTGSASVLHVVIILLCTLYITTVGAGDAVTAALPNLKCLRKVTVLWMNPVPVLQTVGLCGKLQEVSVWYAKHCEVGMRCAYKWMWMCVHSVPDFTVVVDKPV